MFNSSKYPCNYPNIKYMTVVNNITILGSPEPPLNCNISLRKPNTLEIDCQPGFDGGLPQEFKIIVVNTITNKVIMNKTALLPSIRVPGLVQ